MEYDLRLREAVLLVLNSENTTPSHFQRKLNMGYMRSRRILDQMESLGIVGPENGVKPREILMRWDSELENVMQKVLDPNKTTTMITVEGYSTLAMEHRKRTISEPMLKHLMKNFNGDVNDIMQKVLNITILPSTK